MKEERSGKKELVLQSLRKKKTININFVCSGNIIRSPYAELLFEHLINSNPILKSKIRVESSALVYRNTHISIESRDELLKEGITEERVNRFKPRFYKDVPFIFDNADVILVMEEDHMKRIPSSYHHKTFLLLEFTDGVIESIPDPYFDPPFDRSYRMIKEALHKLLKQFEALFR